MHTRVDAAGRVAICVAIATARLFGTRPAHAAEGDNLALGKPVTMSGGNPADPTQQGANCTDGTTGGNYPTNTICRTTGVQTGSNREWIEVDLGQDYVIDHVHLFNRTDGSNGDFARWIVVTTRPSALGGVTSDPQSTLDQTINAEAPFVNKLAYASGNTTGTAYGTGQAAAWTTLDLKVGVHIARYVRIYSMKPAPTALNLAEIQVLEGPPAVRTITNASFEQPAIPAAAFRQVAETMVPGWSTTEPVAVPSAGFGSNFVDGGDIEMWNTGFNAVTSDDGSQFVELNAFTNATLSPTPLCVYPGETFHWKASHRARGTATQLNVAKLRINGQDVATFTDGTTTAATHTCAPSGSFNCTAQSGSPTAAGWGRWEGDWANPSAQPLTMTFEFAAITSTSPGVGNFLDNVSIAGLTAAAELSTSNATGPETTPTANLPLLLVNGSVITTQTVQLNITGGTATRGVDYTTTPATGPITVTIPVGTYDGTPATAISLAPYIQISSDYAVEGDETITLTVSNASSGLSFAGASGCRPGVLAATYTITDVLLPLLDVTKSASPNPFAVGQPASYTITVQNDGNGPTTGNITVSDTLPAGITLASTSGTNWSCTGTTALTCTFTGTLAVGGSTALTLNVNVGLDAVSAASTNSATAHGAGDPTCPIAGATAGHCTGTVIVPIVSSHVCSTSTIFVSQASPTQLDAATFGPGSLVFSPAGSPAPWSYNAIAYRNADHFIYGITQNLDGPHPQNHLMRVDPGTGAVSDLGAVTGGLPAAGGIVLGAFDDTDSYFVGSSSETRYYRVNLATLVATPINLTPSQTLSIGDFAFANGFLWGVDGSTNPARMTRITPSTGAIARFNLPTTVIPTGTAFGIAWTFGNGNLGFSDGTTGNVYQIQVTDPSGTPAFTRVSLASGPPTSQNDGTSCISAPVDLAIVKSGTASALPGAALSWTVTVTNNGPSTSSGYTVSDTVPTGVTGVSSPTAGCTVAGNVVTCVGGTLANGASFAFTINGIAPTPFTAPIVNIVTVNGNESDPISGNNIATATVNPLAPANVTIIKALTAESGTVAGQAEPGEQLTYTLTLTNSGDVAATGYGVTDTLDPNVSFVSADNGGVFAAGDVTWSGLTVPAGGSITLHLIVQVVAPIPPGVARIGNSARQTGQPPPNCSVMPQPSNCTALPTIAQFREQKSAGAPVPTGVTNEYRISYVVTVTNGGGTAGNYNLSDTLTFNGATITTISAPVYASTTGDTRTGTLGLFAPPTGGTIVTGETLAPLGVEQWSYTVTYQITNAALAADCTIAGGGLRNSAALGGAVVGVPPATTCVGAPNVSVVKLAPTPVPTGMPNQFTLTYTVDVKNSGTLPATYNLSDTFSFNGATIDAVSAPVYSSSTGDTQTGTLGTLSPPTGGTIVTNEPITVGGAERWVYTVTYTVTNAVIAQDCTTAGGGLRNQAALGGSLNGESRSCTGAPEVLVGKSVSGPVPTGNLNEYRLSYFVLVRNDGTLAGSYSLSDTFTFPGVSGVAVTAVTHGGPDPLSTPLGTLTPSGGTIVIGESIAAGTSESYSYDVVFTVSNLAALGACSTGGGLTNHAALGGSSAGFVATCSDVPIVTVNKTPSVPVATGAPNQYTITYNVVVSNGGNAAGVYDLSDAFQFAGATVNAVSAVAHGGPDPLSTTLGTLTTAGGTIVSTEPIAAKTSESYSYVVTFTLTNPTVANDCATSGNGLRNTATLGGSVAGSNSTCSGAPVVTVAKALTAESGTQANIAEPGEQLTYTITLTNGGSVTATNYSVSDQLDSHTTFLSATGGGLFAAGSVHWSGLTVPAGGSTSVTVTVIVNAPIAPGVPQLANIAYQTGTTAPACPPVTSQCVVTPTASTVLISKALTAESGTQAGIAEPGEQLTYTITLTNVGGSPALNFATTDQIDPNTTFVSASNGGTFSSGAVLWTGLTVPVSGTLQLTVVVSVATPIPPGVTHIANVAFETGAIPPACPSASAQCSVIPTAAQITPVKALAAESGTQAGVAEPGEQLTYTITLTNTGGSVMTGYAVSDRLDPLTAFVSADNGGVLVAGEVEWSGLTIASGSTLVLTVVVQVASPIPPGATAISDVAYQTGSTPPACPSASPQCSTTSTEAQVRITKTSMTPVATGMPNQFSITYVATATNSGGSTATYTLTDALTFNGATINAISTPIYGTTTGDTQTGTVGSFGLPSGGTIVSGEGLSPLGVETWTYTVTYTVTDAALAANCTSLSGGLRNSAVISGGNTAATCSGAPNVDVLKTAAAPVPTGSPNQFTIQYQTEVRNTGTLPGTYALSDTISFNGAHVDNVSAPVFSSGSGDTQDGTLGTFVAPSGGTIVSGETISVGGEETWHYSVTYTIINPVVAQDCASPSGGLRNSAELGGSFNGVSTNCTGAPAVVIGKSASGPTPTGNPDEYSIQYLVTVQNNGSLSGTYDLSDTFTLPGTSSVTVGAVIHGGSDPLATTLGTLTSSGGTIVTGETIAAGASETYSYTVTFVVANPVAVGVCASSGGLRNLAALGGSSSGQVASCSDVPIITIAKSASQPVGTGVPNQFSIVYAVDVANAGAAAGAYNLADTFTFAGATINAVSAVTHSGSDPLSTTLGTLTASGGTIVTGEPIAPSGSERYAYEVTYTVTDAVVAANCSIPGGGLRNMAALGGSATGSASTCAGAANVDLNKTASVPVPTGMPNQFTITYSINVHNTGSISGTYALGDTLTFNGANIDSVTTPVHSSSSGDSQSGVLGVFGAPSGGTIVSGESIATGGSETWTYVVTYTVTNAPTAQNCASPTGGLRNRAMLGDSFNGQSTTCSGAPQVVIGKTENGPTPTGTPNEYTIDYLVLVQNNGTLSGTYDLSDTFTLPGVTGVTVSPVVHGGSDPLATSVGTLTASGGTIVTGETIAAGASETYAYTVRFTVVDAVAVGVCADGGGIRNLAALGGSSSGVVTTCSGVPNVTIVKTLSSESGIQNGFAEPGETLSYSITLTNSGSSTAESYSVSDPLDPNVTFVSASAGGVLSAGVVQWSGLTIGAGESVTLDVTVRVADPVPAGVMQIANVAYQTGTVPPACVTPSLSCTTLPVALAVLSITKTVDHPTAVPGNAVVYTVTISNVGAGAAIDAEVSDPIPAGIATSTWICAGSGGAVCSNASGNGAVAETIPIFPPGGTLVYTITATVGANPPNAIVNLASVNPPGLGLCAPGNTAPPCQATVTVAVNPGANVPTTSRWGLLFLGLALLAIAWRAQRPV